LDLLYWVLGFQLDVGLLFQVRIFPCEEGWYKGSMLLEYTKYKFRTDIAESACVMIGSAIR
jgi:hypothetical protein